jgi:hypothetical protein
MSLIMVASTKGSPGVTTTCLALAATWPQAAVLAELDPDGGDVRYRLVASDGGPLSTEPGLLSYGSAILDGPDVRDHLQQLSGGLKVLVGLPSATDAAALDRRWSWVGALLDTYPEGDVIADCGRLNPWSPATQLFPYAAGILFLTRPTIDGVGHLRARLEAMEGAPPVFVAVVTGAGDTRSAKQVQTVLNDADLSATVVGSIAYDSVGAGTLAGEWRGRLSRSALMRSARDVARRVDRLLVREVADEPSEQESA